MRTKWLVLQCTGEYFGGKAIELAGRVIDPEYQMRGIGRDMLKNFLTENPISLLTSYTRNPAIIRMIQRVADEVYPVEQSEFMRRTALQVPFASAADEAVYHLDRYGPEGLFRGSDPAENPLYKGGARLKETYPALKSIRHALVVAATINQEKMT